MRQTRNRFIPYIIAIICITSLYSFEFLQNFSDEYTIALTEYKEANKLNKKALNKVKEYSKGTEVGNEYLRTFKEATSKYKRFKEVKETEKVFGFKSLQLFVAEFGPMFCFFCYSLFNLFRSFYFESRNHGMKVLHGLIISGTMFYFFWMFQQFQDFSKVAYYLITIFSASGVVLAVWLITGYENHYINRLKEKYLNLVKFTFINTKVEKRQEMLNLLEKEQKDKI